MTEKVNHTPEQLKELRAKTLEEKIQISAARIIEWYETWGGQVFVSFSGGKDSTVLLHMVRRLYPDVKAVFVDTGLEYPELREFVKTIDNVEVIHPMHKNPETGMKERYTFPQILTDYGYPLISKEVSDTVAGARKGNRSHIQKINGLDKNNQPSSWRQGMKKWKFLVDAPMKIDDECCNQMKKKPSKEYEHRTKTHPFIGTMTEESAQRQSAWLKVGCNAFNSARPISTPMSFWTEQDVLHYIKKYGLNYAPVYGELTEDEKGKLHFTGCQRTGCVFCGYGCHLEKSPNRFQTLKETHPQLYDYCMRGGRYNEDGLWVPYKGLGMDKVLKYIGVETDYDSNEKELDDLTKQAIEEIKKLKEEKAEKP